MKMEEAVLTGKCTVAWIKDSDSRTDEHTSYKQQYSLKTFRLSLEIQPPQVGIKTGWN